MNAEGQKEHHRHLRSPRLEAKRPKSTSGVLIPLLLNGQKFGKLRISRKWIAMRKRWLANRMSFSIWWLDVIQWWTSSSVEVHPVRTKKKALEAIRWSLNWIWKKKESKTYANPETSYQKVLQSCHGKMKFRRSHETPIRKQLGKVSKMILSRVVWDQSRAWDLENWMINTIS